MRARRQGPAPATAGTFRRFPDVMDNILVEAGKGLVQQRVERGFSIEEASDRSGVDMTRIASGENGDLRLTEEELGALADAYGIDVTAFFGGRVTPMQYLFGA